MEKAPEPEPFPKKSWLSVRKRCWSVLQTVMENCSTPFACIQTEMKSGSNLENLVYATEGTSLHSKGKSAWDQLVRETQAQSDLDRLKEVEG